MLKVIIEDSIKPCPEGVLAEPFKHGDRVTFKEAIVNSISEYAELYPEGDVVILKLNKVLNKDRRKYFSVLHFANEKSAYSYGTVVIEIAPNEDVEVRGDILEKVAGQAEFALL